MNKYLYHVVLFSILLTLTSCGTGTEENKYPIYNNQQVTTDTSKLEIALGNDIEVSDGDTIKIVIDAQKTTIRLIGIDSFETSKSNKAYRQAYEYDLKIDDVIAKGKQAKEFLKELLKDKSKFFLEYDEDKTDRYGRILAYVWSSDTKMINMQIICSGYAVVLTIKPNDKYADKFETCFEYARENNLGIWKK